MHPIHPADIHFPFRSIIIPLCALAVFCACGKGGRPSTGKAEAKSAISQPASAPFDGCQPEGTGGDEQLNMLKNRNAEPPSYEPRGIADLLAIRPDALMKYVNHERSSWSDEALAEAQSMESKGVSIEGYFLIAKQSGPESCNCKREDLRDWHVWIGADSATSPADAKLLRNRSVIVEPTPRWQARKGWHLRQVQALARQNARVRVSGWLLWDQEHPEEAPWEKGERATRGTLWEIHPVTKIEVLTGGRWVELTE
jgi:hypothetical protein